MTARYRRPLQALLPLLALAACAAPRAQETAPAAAYTAYIANEASDIVSRVSFAPATGTTLLRRIPVGTATQIDGPHGIAVSPDARHWFVALAHGTPNGRIIKYNINGDTVVGRAGVGLFPEALTVTPDGEYLFVANHGTRAEVASGVSVIHAATMTEVARPTTCVRPSGGSLNARATRHYSVCEVSDQLVSIDTRSFRVVHRFSIMPGDEGLLPVDARGAGARAGAARAPGGSGCRPVAAEAGRGERDRFVYVGCAASREIVEIDAQLWQVTRRFALRAEPVALDVDPAGSTLFVALAGANAVAALDVLTGTERARVPTTASLPRGLAMTLDGRYLFVVSEGAAALRGTVDVIDAATMQRVASAQLEYRPGPIAILSR